MACTMTDDERFELWSTWLGEIYDEVEDLVIRCHVFWEVQSIIRSNPRIDQPNSFHWWMGRSYVDSAVMGVRRQVGIRKDSISFVRLLDDIHREPHILSRQRFVALYQAKDAPERRAHKDFDAAVGSNEQHIPRHMVKADQNAIKKQVDVVEQYAHEWVAHLSINRPTTRLPTFQELDICIDALEKLLTKYWLLFRTIDYRQSGILPIWQYDWKAIFRESWIPEDSYRSDAAHSN